MISCILEHFFCKQCGNGCEGNTKNQSKGLYNGLWVTNSKHHKYLWILEIEIFHYSEFEKQALNKADSSEPHRAWLLLLCASRELGGTFTLPKCFLPRWEHSGSGICWLGHYAVCKSDPACSPTLSLQYQSSPLGASCTGSPSAADCFINNFLMRSWPLTAH